METVNLNHDQAILASGGIHEKAFALCPGETSFHFDECTVHEAVGLIWDWTDPIHDS